MDVLLLECYSLRVMSHTPVRSSVSVLYDYNVSQVTVLLIYVMHSLYMYCRNPPLEDNECYLSKSVDNIVRTAVWFSP